MLAAPVAKRFRALNLNGLLVTRQIDNSSLGPGGGVRQEGN